MLDGPKWIESARFDIVARAFTSVGPTDQPPIDIDALRLMLRALLVERFKMKTHIEERQVSGYALVAANPRLTKADPASRTRCVEGPAPGARDPRNVNPINSRLVTCQNMTTSALAARLQGLAPGYIRTPVSDATGIEGGWNLTLNFSPVGVVGGGAGRGGDAGPAAGAGQPGGGALAASDPNGAITLLEALPRQLGLKLEMQKRSMPVLVIDQLEQKPTEN